MNKRPPKKITESYLYNSSLYYLQRFASSSGHLRNIMNKKISKSCQYHTEQDFSECTKILEKVIEKLKEQNFLNDELYTEAMVNSYRNKGLSSKMITQKLKLKSIPNELIQSKIRKINNQIEEISNNQSAELISALRLSKKKKIGAFSSGLKPKEKELAMLARNGFNYEIAQKSLNMSKEEAEKLINNIC